MDLVPSIPITLDRPRQLRYDVAAFLAVKHKTGRSFFATLKDVMAIQRDFGTVQASETPEVEKLLDLYDRLPLESICVLLWAGLLRDDPGLTLEAVQSMVGLVAAMNALGTLSQAIYTQGAEPPKDAAPPDPPIPSPEPQ